MGGGGGREEGVFMLRCVPDLISLVLESQFLSHGQTKKMAPAVAQRGGGGGVVGRLTHFYIWRWSFKARTPTLLETLTTRWSVMHGWTVNGQVSVPLWGVLHRERVVRGCVQKIIGLQGTSVLIISASRPLKVVWSKP